MIVTKKRILEIALKGEVNYPMEAEGLWYGDGDYKSRGGELVYMSPDEFLSKAKALSIDDETQENVDDLISHINRGGKLDPLALYSLDKTNVRSSDGRHRAIAAKQIGISKLPVLDFTSRTKLEPVMEIIPELFSISEECEDSTFYISRSKETFGKPMMEKTNDCYGVKVNPKYKDLSFMFELIEDMFNNKEFETLVNESEFICEECFELAIEKRVNDSLDVLSNMSDLNEAINYHVDNNISLLENVYRAGSDKHISLIKEAREMWERGTLKLNGEDKHLFEETSLGTFDYYMGVRVPLDLPLMDDEDINELTHKGKDVELNKPKRGGAKKFYVYVRKPGGGVKKVSFGDTTGLSVKLNNPKARKSFAARHDCANKKDRTKASYWSCRLPRYANLLGLKSNFSGYW